MCVERVNILGATCDSITSTWTEPSDGLSYNIRVCSGDGTQCVSQTQCTSCNSYTATGLARGTSYRIMVDGVSSAVTRTGMLVCLFGYSSYVK